MRYLPCVLLLAAAARADYSLPEAKESHVLLAGTWTIKGERLAIPGHAFRIDLFWLADRIDSNLICTGDYRREMRRYLASLKGPVAVELSAVKKGGELFVSGIWPRDRFNKPNLKERSRETLARLDRRRDIAVEVKRVDGQFKIALVNRSKKISYKIVKPNDGSGYGWRPPHIGFRIERLEGGRWVALERKPLPPRCGVFAHDWHRDVVDLEPGARVALESWSSPAGRYDLSRPGRYRLVATYRYEAQKKPGPMTDTPTFEVSSNPFEFKS